MGVFHPGCSVKPRLFLLPVEIRTLGMYYAGTEAGFSYKPVSLFVSKDILLCDGCCEELSSSLLVETLYRIAFDLLDVVVWQVVFFSSSSSYRKGN